MPLALSSHFTSPSSQMSPGNRGFLGCGQSHRCGSSPRRVPGGCRTRHRRNRYRPHMRRNHHRGARRPLAPSRGRRGVADCQLRTEQHAVLARATGSVTGWDACESGLPNHVLDLAQEALHRFSRETICSRQDMGVVVERGRGQGVPEHG